MIKLIKKISEEIINNLITIPLVLLSWVAPKKRGLFLLTSSDGNKFKDNPKYFYLYLLKNKENINPYWATKNKKLYQELKKQKMPVTYLYSLNHFILTLKAEFIICDNTTNGILYDSLFWHLGKFKNIQLWHGTILKKIGLLDDKYSRKNKQLKHRLSYFIQKGRYKSYKLIIASDKYTQYIMKKVFLNENVSITGYPRNDIFYNRKLCFKKNKNDLDFDKYKKIILYAPTYRDKPTEIDPLPDIFLEKLNAFLQKNNYIFLIKKHPFDKTLKTIKHLSNIKDVSEKLNDIQELLINTDILITDYSSVFFDFVLTNKPIIYYPYDYDKYLKICRGMRYNYYKELPGPFVKNKNELIDLIKNAHKWFKEKKYQRNYNTFKNKFNLYQDGKSCERLLREILKK